MKTLLITLAVLLAMIVALIWPNDVVCGGSDPFNTCHGEWR